MSANALLPSGSVAQRLRATRTRRCAAAAAAPSAAVGGVTALQPRRGGAVSAGGLFCGSVSRKRLLRAPALTRARRAAGAPMRVQATQAAPVAGATGA